MSIVKRCAYGSCKNFESKNEKSDDSIFLVPFPKAVTERTRQKLKRWIEACGEEKSETLRRNIEQKRRRLYICSTHFVGKKGPTTFNPDPVPLSSSEDILKVQLFRRRKICGVPDCGSVSTHDELITFHTLPKHHVQLELWKEAIQFDGETLAKRFIFVCSKHFISGMKSDFPSHPDFVPSIFPSSTPQDIKAARNKLREFESGQTKDVLEKSCASLRKHWYECGFKNKDLNEGVRRVKAQKRHLSLQEKAEYEKKKAKLEEAKAKLKEEEKKEREKRKEIENSLRDMKQESGSDTVEEDFVIENDRAEDEEIDLSLVKEEPISDSESFPPTRDEENIRDQSLHCARDQENIRDQSSHATGDQNLDDDKLLSQDDIKLELSDDEYEKSRKPRSAGDDSCDEMLTVHFGNEESSDTETETEAMAQEESTQQSAVMSRSHTGQQVVQLQFDQYKSVQQMLTNQNFLSDSKGNPQGPAQALNTFTTQNPVLSNQQIRNTTQTGPQTVIDSKQVQNTGQKPLLNQFYLPNNYISVGQTGNQQIFLPNNLVNTLGQPLIPVPMVGIQGGRPTIHGAQKLNIPQIRARFPVVNQIPMCLTPPSVSKPSEGLFTSVPMDGTQKLNIPQIGARFPVVNQIPICITPTSGSKPPEGLSTSVPNPRPSIAGPYSGVHPVTSTVAGSSNSNANLKTVVALDPNTYQSPLTNSTTFVVPQENILTLSFGDMIKAAESSEKPKDTSEKPEELEETIYGDEETADIAQEDRYEADDSFTTEMLNQFNRRASTSSEDMQLSSDEDSRLSVHSEGYQPDSSSESSDMSQDEFEIPQSHESSPEIEILNDPKPGETSKKCNKSTSQLLHKKIRGSKKQLPPKPKPKDSVSKECQTDRSLSKEAFLEAKLKEIGVQVTSEQFKYLLKKPLLAKGHCAAFKTTKTVVIDCTVQVDMDKMILPDLAYHCKTLSKEVNDQKARYHALTYDFLQSGSSKSKVNCHTGCFTLKTLKELFEYVSICLNSPPLEDLSQLQEFVLTLMKLRLGLHNYDLAFRFEIPPSLVPQILNKWVSVMANTLCQLADWPLEEPERTEHRNQRWRILKLRYDLLMAYDGIESMKDQWLLEQDLDTIIMICDVLNSFQVKESPEKVVKEDEKVEAMPVKYFVEECVIEDDDEDDDVTSEPFKADDKSDPTESGEKMKDECKGDTKEVDTRKDIEMVKEWTQDDKDPGRDMLPEGQISVSEKQKMTGGTAPEEPEVKRMVESGQNVEEAMDLEDEGKEGNKKDSETMKEGTGHEDSEVRGSIDSGQEVEEVMYPEDKGTERTNKDSETQLEGNHSVKDALQQMIKSKGTVLLEMVKDSSATKKVIDISDVPDTEGSKESSNDSETSTNVDKGTEGTGSTQAHCEGQNKRSKSSKKQIVYQIIHVDDGGGLMIGPPALEVEVVETEHIPEKVKTTPTYGRFLPSEILNCFESDVATETDYVYL